MEKICDLHTHSNYSDGTLTPEELVSLAEKTGLNAIALTDHNTITGLPKFLNALKNTDIETIPGIEFSTHYKGKEYHIVALYIKEEHYDKISNLVKEFDDLKEESNIDLVNKLNNVGMKIDYEDLKKQTPNGRLNRANIAAELTKKGYVSSISEAFKTVLSKSYGLYVEPKRLDTIKTIEFIKEIGATAILAHPLFRHTEEDLEELLPSAKIAGLDAMEVYYSTYTEEETNLAKKIANKYNLLYSGGSDFHGTNKPDINLATGKGNLNIPYNILENLKSKTKKDTV